MGRRLTQTVFCWLSLASMASAVPVRSVDLQTPLGPVPALIYGATGGRLAIGFHGASAHTVNEWVNASEMLADRANYMVVLPRFHENDRTKPSGSLSSDGWVSFVRAVLGADLGQRSTSASDGSLVLPLLLGKSWGGNVAARIAAGAPGLVQRLVLCAPMGSAAREVTIETPAALFYAKDDTGFKMQVPQVRSMLRNLQVEHSALTGGHRVLDEYSSVIVEFASPEVSSKKATAEVIARNEGGAR